MTDISSALSWAKHVTHQYTFNHKKTPVLKLFYLLTGPAWRNNSHKMGSDTFSSRPPTYMVASENYIQDICTWNQLCKTGTGTQTHDI